MSINGRYSLRLRQQRQEELRRRREQQRKEKVRQEAKKLIADSRQTGKRNLNHMIQHFSQSAQYQAQDLSRQAERLLESDPDQAVKLARKARATMERAMAEASNQLSKWSQEKTAAQEAVTCLRLALESTLNNFASDNDNSCRQLEPVAHQLAAANTALRQENFDAAKQLAVTGQDQVQQIEQTRFQRQEQEAVRQEIVRGLHQVLIDMGFAVVRGKPDKNSENNNVILIGDLPSGRTARFAISLDGQIEYDFNGYLDRACGKTSENIRHQLERHCQAETTVVESHWKDEVPDLRPGAAAHHEEYRNHHR